MRRLVKALSLVFILFISIFSLSSCSKGVDSSVSYEIDYSEYSGEYTIKYQVDLYNNSSYIMNEYKLELAIMSHNKCMEIIEISSNADSKILAFDNTLIRDKIAREYEITSAKLLSVRSSYRGIDKGIYVILISSVIALLISTIVVIYKLYDEDDDWNCLSVYALPSLFTYVGIMLIPTYIEFASGAMGIKIGIFVGGLLLSFIVPFVLGYLKAIDYKKRGKL